MEPDVVAFLEEILETGFVWDEPGLADLAGRLAALGGSPVAELAHGFAGLGLRLGMGEGPEPLRREAEAFGRERRWTLGETVRVAIEQLLLDGTDRPEGEDAVPATADPLAFLRGRTAAERVAPPRARAPWAPTPPAPRL